MTFLLIKTLKRKDIAKLNASEMTAIYNGPKGVLKTDDVSNPKLFVYSSIKIPENILQANLQLAVLFLKTLYKDQRTPQVKFEQLLFPKS